MENGGVKRMQIFAHRGYSGKFPENTMAAFKAVLDYEVEGVELDVQMTKDGQLVVIHDEKVNRTTNGKGSIVAMELDEIKKLDAGSWFHPRFKGERIPTLEEVLKLYQNTNLLVNIELKSNQHPYYGMDMKVVKLVEELGMSNQVILSSFDHETLIRIAQVAPQIEIAPLLSNIIISPWKYTKALTANAMHISGYYMQRQTAINALEQGAIIRVYTINTEAHFKMCQQANVAAIFTDEIEAAIEWRKG